ncbi:MAG: MFS transporter [Campylobacterales bacterium]|nr:MFS transporter [Campylobacterales bacterium]
MIPALSFFYFFYFSLVGVYVIFLPKALLSFGYSEVEIGIIFAAAPFMRFLIPFLFKKYFVLDNRVFVASLIFTFVGTVLIYLWIDDFWLYLLANLILGGAMGVTLPYIETVALSQLTRDKYGKVRLFGSIGFMAIALWLGKILVDYHHVLYYLAGSAFFTMLMGYWAGRYDSDEQSQSKEQNASFSILQYRYFWISIFLMQLGFGGFYNFFTIYETSHGISLEMTSWMWSFGVICEIVMLYFQGPLLQRNLLTIIKLSTLITVFRWWLLYAYPASEVIAFTSQSLHAFSFALYHSASITYIYTLYTQKRLAQQFLLGIAFGLGGSMGALLAGQIYGEYLFLIEAFITLVAFGVLFLHKDNLKVASN